MWKVAKDFAQSQITSLREAPIARSRFEFPRLLGNMIKRMRHSRAGTKPYDSARGGPIQNLFWNSLVHLDVSTGHSETWFAGETSSVQEPVFLPRSASAAEGDGCMIALINRRDCAPSHPWKLLNLVGSSSPGARGAISASLPGRSECEG
jgi:carotenoid cleavage dioxygenase-like enzyme